MKHMKKIILTTALLLFSYLGFSQTVPTAQMRIENRTTAFGQNLPAGTQIFCESDSTLWQANDGIASTETINSARAFLVLINKEVLYTVDQFEAAVTPSTTYTLAFTPITATTGLMVTMNGAALRPTTDYTSSGTTLTIVKGQKKYDTFVVSYTYSR
jgi:hypothetical protein